MKKKLLGLFLVTLFIVGVLFFLYQSKVVDLSNIGLLKPLSKNISESSPSYTPLASSVDYNSDLLKGIKCILPKDIPVTRVTSLMSPLVKENSTTADDYWLASGILPVVLGYKNINGINYMIGGLKNEDGSCYPMVFVLTGKFDVVDNSNRVKSDMIKVDSNYISLDEFQKNNPVGKSTRVFFLSRRLNSDYLVNELCSLKGEKSETWCTYQRITELFLTKAYDFMQISTLFRINPNVDQFYVVFAKSTLSDAKDPAGTADDQP